MGVKLTVVVLTWNSERYLENCLDSLLLSLNGISSEIIIIDNGSTDSTRKLIAKYTDDQIHVIYQEKNVGVSSARNIGLKKSKGEYILLLDVDTVSNSEAFSTMLDFMENHSSCGICSCKLKNSVGDIQNSCRKIPSFRYKFLNIIEAILDKWKMITLKETVSDLNQSQFYRSLFDLKEAFEVQYLIGACQLIRRAAFEKVGLLDEQIFYGPEDADFCIRLSSLDWKIFYLPYVSIIHEYQQISRKRLLSKISFIHLKGLMYFFWKYKRA